jgi:hypothetical protein
MSAGLSGVGGGATLTFENAAASNVPSAWLVTASPP